MGVGACDAPAGYVADDTDCDDAIDSTHPGASETCNSVDDDCDTTVDEGATDALTWYLDFDADTFGGDTTTLSCTQPSGYVSETTDCDDLDSDSHPNGTETCDDADNDCNTVVDDDATDAPGWYYDFDGDGYGDSEVTTMSCDQPGSYVADSTDCDDAATAVNPAATETCNDIDDDCEGGVDEDGVCPAPALTATSGCSAETFDGYNVGWVFTTSSTITVSSLGWYDHGSDGLSSAHTVAIFDTSGSALTSVDVPAGTAGTLGSGFRYTAISPYTLAAGTYVVGGTSGAGDPFLDFCGSATVASPLGYSQGRYIYGASLAYPSTAADRGISYFGPNFLFN